MSIRKYVEYYTRRMLDGKWHIFKHTEYDPAVQYDELDILFDHKDLAENYVKAKNSEVKIEEIDIA